MSRRFAALLAPAFVVAAPEAWATTPPVVESMMPWWGWHIVLFVFAGLRALFKGLEIRT